MTPEGIIIGDDGLARPVWASTDPLMREYYDTEWGLPVRDEQGLYERISLEAFQAGLSWATILRKRPAFRAAFADFHPETVAAFTEADVERLLQDPGIVRNRLKIRAAITNAQRDPCPARGGRARGFRLEVSARFHSRAHDLR